MGDNIPGKNSIPEQPVWWGWKRITKTKPIWKRIHIKKRGRSTKIKIIKKHDSQ